MRAPATSPDVRSACFPAACSLAATFDLDLASEFGSLLAQEACAKDVNCILGPTVCIHRHPLGGRNFESFSEDPFLAGKMASRVIQGLQNNGVSATIKHFVANEQETARTSVNETISERALHEIYLRPFEIAIKEANPWAIMTAYNLVNGTHCDSHEWLLRDVLRGSWGWNGLVMSDWGGTNSIADALRAGLDLEMPGPPRIRKFSAVLEAIEKGEVSEDTIDDRVQAVLELALKLKTFEKAADPVVDGDKIEHREFIRDAGARGIVLLKNADQILPLSRDKLKNKKIALIGYAKEALAHGGGSASVNAHYKVTPEEGLKAALGDHVQFSYAKGAHLERLLPPISKDRLVGALTGLDGKPGFSLLLFEEGKEEPSVTRHGYPASAYSPLGSNESYQKIIEIVGDFTPTETGSHYIASSGFGPTMVSIDEKVIYEQKGNTSDPMGSLFNSIPEPEVQYNFISGKTYRVRIRSEPPRNIGLRILEGRTGVRMGFSLQSVHDADLKGDAMRLAADADYAIVFTGHGPQWETEGQDQASFHLPHGQDELITAVAKVNRNVIVVNCTGVPVAMPWLGSIKGLLQAWFPGQECGNAIADVILGSVNPEGRLPVSFPRRIEDAPAHGNFPGQYVNGQLQVRYGEGVFVGYRHYDLVPRDKVNFPFGYGLSYTAFEFGDLDIRRMTGDSLDVTINVANTGAVRGGVLVQLYAGREHHSIEHPLKTLIAFKKIRLEPNEQKLAQITVQLRDLAYFDEKLQRWTLDEGRYVMYLGSSAADILRSVKLDIEQFSWKK